MANRSKKGFTLIELLAVILILGIIALIAIPTVNNIINESKRGAYERTVDNLVRAIEQNCEIELLRGSAITNSYTLTDGVISPTIGIKGRLPDSGTINVNNECNISFSSLIKDDFIASKQIDSNIITISLVSESRNLEVCNNTDGTCSNGIVYLNPVTGNTCTKAEADANVNAYGTPTEIKTGCMKWYVYKDNGNGTYQLILDHNTTALSLWNASGYNYKGMTSAQAELDKLVNESGWILTPDLIDAQDIADLVGAGSSSTISFNKDNLYRSEIEDKNTQSGYFYFDGGRNANSTSYSRNDGWRKAYAVGQGTSNFGWLYDYTYNCANNGCNVNDNNLYQSSISENIYNIHGYWTKDYIVSNRALSWCVSFTGLLADCLIDSEDNESRPYHGAYRGIRPVVTIPKSSV